MQIYIAKLLNRILVAFTVVIITLAVGMYFVSKNYHDIFVYYVISFALITLALVIFFKYLETSWDKNVITRMAKSGKIALAHLKNGTRYLPLRDTSFTSFWIYEFDAVLYGGDHKGRDVKIYEKMNRGTETPPSGWVYVTWDEAKPAQIFIIPNALIGALPNLAPLVTEYEKDKKLNIKYLEAYYLRGINLRTFRDMVAEKKAAKDKKK
jgi:hypothetical protein